VHCGRNASHKFPFLSVNSALHSDGTVVGVKASGKINFQRKAPEKQMQIASRALE
jgi:hypothetical protein